MLFFVWNIQLISIPLDTQADQSAKWRTYAGLAISHAIATNFGRYLGGNRLMKAHRRLGRILQRRWIYQGQP
jgi:hypothetical protein